MEYTFTDEIIENISKNSFDYKGYLELGDYFLEYNEEQAYLCYENAMFFAPESEKKNIREKIDFLIKNGVFVPKCAIVILSYNNRQVTQNCIESIRKNTPESARDIIVVDNASVDDSVLYLREQKDVVLIENKTNEGFPKGCNQGIERANEDSDILLLNNDVLMMPNTLFWLRMGLYADKLIGSAGSVSNKAYMQWSGEREGTTEYFENHAKLINIPMKNPLELRTWLVGFCLLLKRISLNKIGYLDEGFSPGNGEDEDICLRLLLAGYYNVLVRNSYLVHLEHASFNRRKDYRSLVSLGWKRIKEKYGRDMDSYFFANDKMCSFFSRYKEGNRFLEINCGIGANLFNLKSQYPEKIFEGIERDITTCPFRNNNALINMGTYSDIKYSTAMGQYDGIIFDTSSIDKNEVNAYFTFCVDHLRPEGKLMLMVDNGQFYQLWCEQLLSGKASVKGNVTLQDIEPILNQLGLQVEVWVFYYVGIEQVNEKEGLYELIEMFPKELKEKVLVKKYGLIVKKI